MLDKERKRRAKKSVGKSAELLEFDALRGRISILEERLEILYLKEDSRGKRIRANVFYSTIIIGLFLASYMFMIVPAFWEASDVQVVAGDLMEDYHETGGVFRAEEIFAVDNGNGTFALYVDGKFVAFVDDTNDFYDWVSVHLITYE